MDSNPQNVIRLPPLDPRVEQAIDQWPTPAWETWGPPVLIDIDRLPPPPAVLSRVVGTDGKPWAFAINNTWDVPQADTPVIVDESK
jgi:hypothetical protein